VVMETPTIPASAHEATVAISTRPSHAALKQ